MSNTSLELEKFRAAFMNKFLMELRLGYLGRPVLNEDEKKVNLFVELKSEGKYVLNSLTDKLVQFERSYQDRVKGKDFSVYLAPVVSRYNSF